MTSNLGKFSLDRFKWLAVALGMVLITSAVTADERKSVILEVQAGDHERGQTPVSVRLPKQLVDSKHLLLTRVDNHQSVNVQVLHDKVPHAVWLNDEPLPAGSSRRYRLAAADDSAETEHPPAVDIATDDRRILVTVNERPVLQYNHAAIEPPAGLDKAYRRSGYIHPVFDPEGRALTDDFAPDHPHQHGLFFAWTNTTFEGRHLNFWEQQRKTGSIEHVSIESQSGGPVFGQFMVRLRHADLTAPGGKKPVLDETWLVRVFAAVDPFLFDITSVQRCAGESPLTINQYHYGAMALRGTRLWLTGKESQAADAESDFLTSEGKGRSDGNHSRPKWVDLYGKLDGRFSGIAVLGHPENFRFPQPVRLHPSKPYFCFAPLVDGDFEISTGKAYVSRYRYVVHRDRPNSQALERLWHDYAQPPVVKILP